jgi:sulfite exporter TauE/SafE
VLLAYQGLVATGLIPQWRIGPATSSCLAAGFFRQFLRPSNSAGIFLAGLFTGFLPCGLLYGMLALAMSTHSVLWGGLTMAVFGLGTAPGMILTGVGGRLLHVAARRRLFACAAWCLVLAGVVSIVRGASFISAESTPTASCPACGP